jgi:hypothetical protein
MTIIIKTSELISVGEIAPTSQQHKFFCFRWELAHFSLKLSPLLVLLLWGLCCGDRAVVSEHMLLDQFTSFRRPPAGSGESGSSSGELETKKGRIVQIDLFITILFTSTYT